MGKSNSILVIGATGMLGEPVARQLCADGYPVRVFTRTPEKARAKFDAEYEIVAGDVEVQQSLDLAMKGCWGVHINLSGGLDPDLERRGVEHIVRAAAKAGVRRITYLSGATVTEENSWFAGTRSKFRAEAAIRASGIPYTIFKATFVMETLPRYVRGKRATIVGKQPHPWHWVAARDYASIVSKAYATPEAENKTLFIHGPEAYTMFEALEKYCAIVHPDLTVRRLPLWVGAMIGRLTRDQELKYALSFLRYTEKVGTEGDAREANALFGAPTTTLEQWCKLQVRRGQ